MDNIPGWKIFSAGVGIAGLCVLGYFCYQWFLASPSDLKKLQEEAAGRALDELARIYVEKVRTEGEQVVVVMPVQKDTSNGQIRSLLMSRLNSIEGVKADKPRDPTLDERAAAVFKSMVNKDAEKPDPNTVFAQSAEADEVISISVEKLWSGADSGICEIDVYRITRDSGTERKARVEEPQRIKGLSGTAVPPEDAPDEGPGFWSGLGGFLWRMLAVLAATALLPFIAWPGVKAALRADSNAINAGVLTALTVLDLVVLFALAGFTFTTTAVVSAGLLLPVAALYNLRLMNFIEEQ